MIFSDFPNKTGGNIVIQIRRGMEREKLERKIASLKAGDTRAFDYVYEHTHKPVYFAILYVVKNKADAEDLLQETFVRALRSLGSYEAGSNFTGWLVRIGKNLALNHLSRARREVATDFSEQAWKYGTREHELPYLFDLAAKVLAEDEYEILMLCQTAGYKRREVAAMLNIPIGTVTWKNNEALKKLRKILEQEGDA